jgi:diguanylate cyclase (GGDEF)-like protein
MNILTEITLNGRQTLNITINYNVDIVEIKRHYYSITILQQSARGPIHYNVHQTKRDYLLETGEIKALCILAEGELESEVLDYLEKKQVNFRHLHQIPDGESRECDADYDLILLDADLDGGDVLLFFDQCGQRHHSIPIVAFHDGARGSRDTALIRMGAFDAFPKDMGRWNTEIYLDRALEQARMVKTLLSQSRTDHVTGLYNQRYLYENLQREIRRTIRTKQPLCVALLDLDNFKAYNDTYGHLAGDEALQQVAGVLAGAIRQGVDSAYRYGGDEFMIILPNTGLDDAVTTLERILKDVSDQLPKMITFSIGIASLADCDGVQPFIKAADMAMYEAKQSGGNRIVSVECGGSG